MNRGARLIVGTIAVTFAVVIWDGLSFFGLWDRELFPPMLSVFGRVFELAADPNFWAMHVGGSLRRLTLAACVAVPLAIFLGVVAGRSRWLYAALAPFVNFTMPLPKVAIFPLVLVMFGIGDGSKIVLIAIGIFYPLLIGVLNGMWRLLAGPYQDVAQVYGVRGLNLWMHVYLRGLIPDILTGLKTALGYGFTLVVVSEVSASTNGLGHFIWRAWDAYAVRDMYAGVIYLCFFGWIVQTVLDRLLIHRLRRSPPS